MCASFDTFPHLSQSIKMAFSLCHLNTKYDTTCIVFLKESLRKTHFDPFSAVSKDLGILQILWNAEWLTLPIYTLKTTHRAQKTRIFDAARDPRRAPYTQHTSYTPYFSLTTIGEGKGEGNQLCTQNLGSAHFFEWVLLQHHYTSHCAKSRPDSCRFRKVMIKTSFTLT